MVKLFGKLFKLLPLLGAGLVIAAVVLSIRQNQMGQLSLAMIGLGFLFFLTLLVKIELASLRFYLNLSVLGILIFANTALIYQLSMNHQSRWDLTRNKRRSLTPETRLVLQSLKVPVTIDVIAGSNEPYASYFKLYTKEQPRFLKVNIINPRASMALLEGEGTQSIEMGDILISAPAPRSEPIDADNVNNRGVKRRKAAPIRPESAEKLRDVESKIVNAIAYVVQERATRIYFTSGHGEKSIENMAGTEVEDVSIFKFGIELQKRGMRVSTLNLETEGIIPDDCDMLAIIGPKVDFLRVEQQAIQEYLDRGGRLLLCVDPMLSSSNEYLNGLRSLIYRYGAVIRTEMIYDSDSHAAGNNGLVPLIGEIPSYHAIPQGIKANMPAMPLKIVAPIDIRKEPAPPPQFLIAPLLSTTPNSQLLKFNEYTTMVRAKELPPATEKRRYNAAVAIGPRSGVKNAQSLPRMVIFGDSDFLTNSQLGQTQLTLAVRSVSWMTDKDLIAIAQPIAAKDTLLLTRKEQMLLGMTTVVILPFAVFFGGLVYTTLRRRKR